MPNDDHKHSGHFDAAMPLPGEVKIRHDQTAAVVGSNASNPAADLIRQKIEAVYQNAPPAAAEVEEVNQLGKSSPQSKHQQFIDDLINSGKALPEIQTAWHEYYAGLTDHEKHAVWQEFYAEHADSSHFTPAVTTAPSGQAQPILATHQTRSRRGAHHIERVSKKVAELRRPKAATTSHNSPKPADASPLHSILFGLGIGSIVMVIFLFSFFNERFIAPFIQPSRTVTNTPIISDSTTIGSDPEVIIPKINVQIPVIYDVTTINDAAVESALENGVVHYADTALPGQDGNGVIVGHSSNNIFNQGKYKFAFVLLSRLDTGDTFYLQKDGVRYTYEVYKKSIVKPTDVSVLAPQDKPATFSLITCDPPGTSTNRLVVVGQQISPDPGANTAQATTNAVATKSAVIPGNSPTLWSRIVKWFKA